MSQNNFAFSRKQGILLFLFVVFSLLGLVLWQEIRFHDGKLHIVFCNVGQGDAIFIRTPAQNDILIDGGPDRKVLDCLSEHMPFWDKKLELVVLSHPHQDHFAGLIDVMQSYTIKSFVTEKITNESSGFRAFENALKDTKIISSYFTTGDKVKTLDGVTMKVLGPTAAFLAQTSPTNLIGESNEFGSLIWQVSYGDFDLLLTSDAQVRLLKQALETVSSEIDIMQVPHHGSKYGLDLDLIDQIDPKLAIISVGKNRFGHPSGEVLKMLQDKAVKTVRTDQNGEIEIVTEGRSFRLAKELLGVK